jgi:hypothetical protein
MFVEGGKLELRECATFCADVYCDGKLFARELSRPVAESFIEEWMYYPNAFADEAKFRTWMIENWDSWVQVHLAKKKPRSKK